MHMQNDYKTFGIVFVIMLGIVIMGGIIFFPLYQAVMSASDPPVIQPFGSNCINMNGNPIEPNPELCKMSCTATTEWDHMQAHYDEVCACCKARNIDYSNAGAYQERVYVVNADGSRGEDRTCAYYPEAEGCPKDNLNGTDFYPSGGTGRCNNTVTVTEYVETNTSRCNGGSGGHGMNSSFVTDCIGCNCTTTTTKWDCSLGEHINATEGI